MPTARELGRRLRRLREDQGLTEEDVANRAGVSIEEVETFEAGGSASAECLLSLADAMTSARDVDHWFIVPKFTDIAQVV